MTALQFPAPYFGGKRPAAATVWNAIGRDVRHYIEPFCGSAAVLLAEPARPERMETINDADGYVVNALRALKFAPEETARWADWPVSETDLMARHLWLVNEGKPDLARLATDPEWCDPKAAGWWLWGLSAWIGPGWCTGGPWTRAKLQEALARDSRDGVRQQPSDSEAGVQRAKPHLARIGMGVQRKRPHLTTWNGVHRPDRERRIDLLMTWFGQVSKRLERVRITCGDWSRVVTPAVLRAGEGITGVFLDPPYRRDNGRDPNLYRVESDVFAEVAAWAFAHGDDPRLRIVLAGWEGDADPPPGWRAVSWKNHPGYDRDASYRLERLWLSPHCRQEQVAMTLELFVAGRNEDAC